MKNPEEIRSRWYRHFSNILNIPSEYCETAVENLPPQPTRSDVDDSQTDEELESALSKLKHGKADGKTGIPPEMVAYGGADLWDRLLEIMKVIWKEKRVVRTRRMPRLCPSPRRATFSPVIIGEASVFLT